MDNRNIKHSFETADLIAGYLQSTLSELQKDELFNWVAQSETNRKLFFEILNEQNLDRHFAEFAAYNSSAALEKLKSRRNAVKVITWPSKRWLSFSVAASLLLMLSFGFWLQQRQKSPIRSIAKSKTDAAPGGNKAILTLANGSKIVLDSASNGNIARQGHTNISKIQNGRLVYLPAGNELPAASKDTPVVTWNTVSTPKGGQYAVVLPDGSNIWLNAASSVTFPTAFTGKERKVKITGEVYLEVKKNAAMPFLVEAKGQMIQVLGTHFNVNAYDDEPVVKTTLLEGRIQLHTNTNSEVLIPGQQAIVDNQHVIIKNDVDMEATIAWKNGYFIFDHTDLPSLMRQLSRWYDVNIIYSGSIRPRGFIGQISRQTNLSNVLKILALSGVRFKIVDKNLYIQP